MKLFRALSALFTRRIPPSAAHQGIAPSIQIPELPNDGRDIEDVIKTYFNMQKWRYRVFTEEDSTITFKLGFIGENEHITLHVCILPNKSTYQILCQTGTKLPIEVINNGIIAMNDYNMKAQVVSGCISSEGNIIFWIGRNIDGYALSEQAFEADFGMVLNAADFETAQIYKQAYNPKN